MYFFVKDKDDNIKSFKIQKHNKKSTEAQEYMRQKEKGRSSPIMKNRVDGPSTENPGLQRRRNIVIIVVNATPPSYTYHSKKVNIAPNKHRSSKTTT